MFGVISIAELEMKSDGEYGSIVYPSLIDICSDNLPLFLSHMDISKEKDIDPNDGPEYVEKFFKKKGLEFIYQDINSMDIGETMFLLRKLADLRAQGWLTYLYISKKTILDNEIRYSGQTPKNILFNLKDKLKNRNIQEMIFDVWLWHINRLSNMHRMNHLIKTRATGNTHDGKIRSELLCGKVDIKL